MLDIGFFEIVMLAAVALFVFGPDKLPKMAADAGRLLRQLRKMAQGAKDEVTGSLGPEFSDLNLSDLDPRAFVKRQLLEETEDLDRVLTDEPDTSVDSTLDSSVDPPTPVAPKHDDGDAT